MNRILMLALFAVLIQSSVYPQYVVEYPYLYFQDSYSTPLIGSSYFALQRPTDAYTSMRLRSLSPGFNGLVRDEYSDLFRNPAVGLAATSSGEVFGDLGSVNDLGRFTLGGFFKTEQNTLGASTTLDRLLKRTSTYESQNSSGTPLSVSNTTDIYESNPEGIGARISSSFLLADEHSFGLSYEYFTMKNGFRDEYSNTYTSSGSYSKTSSTQEVALNSDVHRIGVGGIIKTERGEVQLTARGVFSTSSLKNLYQTSSEGMFNHRTTSTNYPTEIKTNGYLLGILYECSKTEGQVIRSLFEFALTRYTSSGTSLDDALDSSYSIYRTTRTGSRSSDGTILDFRCGVGYERHLFGGFTGYAGGSIGYIRNSSDATGSSISNQVTPPPTNPPTITLDDDESVLEGIIVRLPVGAEALIGEYVALRGGVEPSYQSGQTSIEYRGTSLSPLSSANSSKNKIEQRGLAFSSQFGVAVHHDDYGEMSILLGKNIADTTYWSFFLRYFL